MNSKGGKMKTIFLCILAALCLSGCADSVTLEAVANMEPVGFWHGFWHGLIVSFAFIGSLFCDDIAIYAIYNNGVWYDFGFCLGVATTIRSSRR